MLDQRFDSVGFRVRRHGVIMRSRAGEPHEAWGVLNPGGVRAPDGTMHLFPRLIAEGNYSRIGHVRVVFDDDVPVGVERLGIALEPHESYEVAPGGGGVEDPRVVYFPLLQRYVMTYTAFVPYQPRVAIAISEDLQTWQRLGLLKYAVESDEYDLNACGNKDAAFFSDVVSDPEGVPSFGILHRPTTRLHIRRESDQCEVTLPPQTDETVETVWISYVPVAAVQADIRNLTSVRRHEHGEVPQLAWNNRKIGVGAPPIRLPYGWVCTYHGVSSVDGRARYSMGIAIVDLERPSRLLYNTPLPILEPQMDYERDGLVNDVVFPSAADARADGSLDVFYGAADRVIAVARITLPDPSFFSIRTKAPEAYDRGGHEAP